MVEIEDVKKQQKKDIILSIRTTKEKYAFLKKNDISPQKLFNKAIEELQSEITIIRKGAKKYD